jgi:tetratricopeptide (TPR) repeat protein
VTRPNFPLAVIAAELRQATRALDPFEGGDLTSDVRAVFSWSYRALPEPAARLFRLLGLHPGPDISVAAAASLAAFPLRQAKTLMGELDRAHLLSEHRPGQYAFHDLLRAYAAELAEAHDSQDARDDAVGRLVEHYLHTGHRAATLIEPHYDPLTLSPPRPGAVTAKLADAEGALAWFNAEHNALLATITAAADSWPTQAWQLAWSLSIFLLWRGMWHQQTLACQAGLEAARRTGDVAGEAHSLNRLACGYARSGRMAEADPLFRQSLRLFEELGDHVSQAIVHGSLGWLAGVQDRPAESLGHCLRALDEYRAANHRAGQALVLNDVGYAYALLGNYRQALTYCKQALAATQELGAQSWEVAVWDSLGYIHHRLGDYKRAISGYERSVALARQLADRASQAEALEHLGDVHSSAGDVSAAQRAWTGSLRILDEMGHPDADAVRVKLQGSYVRLPSAVASGRPGEVSVR